MDSIEIKGIKLNDIINEELKGEYGLNNKENLLVCKNNETLPFEKYESICCKYDIELKKCGNLFYYIINKIEIVHISIPFDFGHI